MNEYASVIRLLGGAIIVIAALMLGPLALTLGRGGADAGNFLLAIFLALMTGAGAIAAFSPKGDIHFERKHAFLFTSLAWLVCPCFAAIPFGMYGMSMADAYFEAVSGDRKSVV